MHRIIVIGDGSVETSELVECKNTTPESPAPWAKTKEIRYALGMAGNVVENLKKFDVHIDINVSYRVYIKRFIDYVYGSTYLRVDNPIERFDSLNFKKIFNEIRVCNAIIISDYDCGALSYDDIISIISVAKEHNKPVFVDTPKHDLYLIQERSFYYDKLFFKLNEKEAKNAKYHEINIIKTLGGNGSIFVNEDNLLFSNSLKAPQVDVCGCGDTFLSAFVVKYIETLDLQISMDYANIAAGVAVTKQGLYQPSIEEIELCQSVCRYVEY